MVSETQKKKKKIFFSSHFFFLISVYLLALLVYHILKEDRKKGMAAPTFTPAGQSTQMITGATPSNDQAILHTSADLYKNYKLRRVY